MNSGFITSVMKLLAKSTSSLKFLPVSGTWVCNRLFCDRLVKLVTRSLSMPRTPLGVTLAKSVRSAPAAGTSTAGTAAAWLASPNRVPLAKEKVRWAPDNNACVVASKLASEVTVSGTGPTVELSVPMVTVGAVVKSVLVTATSRSPLNQLVAAAMVESRKPKVGVAAAGLDAETWKLKAALGSEGVEELGSIAAV